MVKAGKIMWKMMVNANWMLAIRTGSRSTGHFFFHAADGIRGRTVTGVQTCALPIFRREVLATEPERERLRAVWVHLVARAAEDRLDEGLGDPTLGLEKIHCSASNGRGFASIWCKSSYYSEEASRRALRARDLVEGRRELDPPARQRAKVRQALHDDDPGAKDHAVHREVLGREVRQARAVLLEKVEADVLRAASHEPFRRLGREVGRLGEVVGPPAVHPVGPVGAE